ncbi:MAG: hypothetical protein ACHQAX_08590 [Gammaproteobacteria bacterium]
MTQVEADFTQYPLYNPGVLGLDVDAAYPQELTLGDLSGNLLMLMWVLITAGMAKMSEGNYRALVKLQQDISAGHEASFAIDKQGNKKTIGGTPKKPGIPFIDISKVKGLSKEQQTEFLKALSGTKFIPNNILLRLEGDEVADRIGDDSMMINTLFDMAEQGVEFHINASNHLHYFVQYFLSQKPDDDEDEDESFDDLILNGQGVSLLHMMKSIKNGVVDENDIRHKIQTVYSTRLKLIDYSIGNTHKKMSLYAHAPFTPDRILKAAEALKVRLPTASESFENTNDVVDFINNINRQFNIIYVSVYFSGKSKEDLPALDEKAERCASEKNPIGALLWMKDYDKLDKDPSPACFNNITFEKLIHGHTDAPEHSSMPNRFSLNSDAAQPNNHYLFCVAVSSVKPKKILSIEAGEAGRNESGMWSPTLLGSSSPVVMGTLYQKYMHRESTNNPTPNTADTDSGPGTPTGNKNK